MLPQAPNFSAYRFIFVGFIFSACHGLPEAYIHARSRQSVIPQGRERVGLNSGWRFYRSETNVDGLVYDHRPDTVNETITEVLKPWILPSSNHFIKDPAQHHQRPAGNPGSNITFVQKDYDDSGWEHIDLPHDWAIQGPFYAGDDVPVGGGMGRLPVHGIGWYRRKLNFGREDNAKSIYLDIDGAMSYAVVWLNGKLVGGWPYGYNSFRLDLTPYLELGNDNQLAIRLDNLKDSSRWYPGGGIYRNVWLTKVGSVHVAQWGTFITSKNVSARSATVDAIVQIQNVADTSRQVEVTTDIYELDSDAAKARDKVASFKSVEVTLLAQQTQLVNSSLILDNPKLWGPFPSQHPNLYVAITRIHTDNSTIDTYESRFGIRSLQYEGSKGLLVNDEHIRVQGVNQHHDLGAIGSAFNIRAAQRQLDILRDLGCNAIRMSHNPPAPELLNLTDQMGFLVVNEIFDSWERNKTASDFHLIFPDWHEADLRSFLRRDRNHPSVVVWSLGNEVGEQYTNETGAAVGERLHSIAQEEDATRPYTASMNYAKPYMPFPRVFDILSLNYQGEGIRDAPAYSHLSGTKTPPLYADYNKAFPNKMLWSSESAATISSRGTYIFPVTSGISAPVNDTSGGNSTSLYVSAYELYSADFGSSPDKVFAAQDKNSYVAGEFVWAGFDYLGEPTPYYSARSSYFGIIDLAGFKKDRFFLYQSRWRPELPTAHILPHWTWPSRIGQITPVHVFSSADEAELFLNGQSQGRKRKAEYEYRFRWDDVRYEAGELHVVTYKNGDVWANDTVNTAGIASKLEATADRTCIANDGKDLSFITIKVMDSTGNVVPEAENLITFSISGPGYIVATDNGDPRDLTAFSSHQRKAFNGLALVIVRAIGGASGPLNITASGDGLPATNIIVQTQ